MNYIGWLIVFVIFAALELVSLGMTCIWFAIGALAACVTSLITGNWIIQAFVFIIVTAVVLILLRPIAVKHINNKAEKTHSGLSLLYTSVIKAFYSAVFFLTDFKHTAVLKPIRK